MDLHASQRQGTFMVPGDHVTARVMPADYFPTCMAAEGMRTCPASPFEQVVVTDTTPLKPAAPADVRVASCASIVTDTISRIFTSESVSDVFGAQNHK